MAYVNLNHLRAQIEILRLCKQKIAEMKELASTAEDTIKAELGPGNIGLLDDEPAVEWTTTKRNTLDQKALKADHPEIVEEYMSVGEVNRFTLK